MSSAQAIVLGAVLIAASILFVSTIHPAEAQRVGPFQLMHHSNNLANAGVFRLDTSTGEVSYCFISGEGTLSCTKER
ncbi:MAG: hypothetical protein M3N08_04175 [Pseudomonadota bacterium]|nr:hypothetical protein [Pseudomonadota bacterium]